MAGVVLGSTRVIYDSSSKEATLTLTNTRNAKSYLVQSWLTLENGDNKNVPFIVTPPLFRLGPDKKGLLRIVNTDSNLPSDRESVFWLNVKPIPASENEIQNELQVVIKSTIKLIYRPEGIKDDAPDAYKKLKFSINHNVVDIYNPTPFYINLYSLEVDGHSQDNISMVAPFSHSTVNSMGNRGDVVKWQAINDNGALCETLSVTL